MLERDGRRTLCSKNKPQPNTAREISTWKWQVGGNGVPCTERMVSCCVEGCVRFAWRNKGGGELCRSLHAVPRVRTKMFGGLHVSAALVVMRSTSLDRSLERRMDYR